MHARRRGTAGGDVVSSGPTATTLTIEPVYPEDGVTVVSLGGECDPSTVDVLKRALTYVVEDDPEGGQRTAVEFYEVPVNTLD